MKKILILAAAVLAAFGAKAQMRSSGAVPADLKMTVQELYDSDMQRAKKYAGGRVKNKEQVMESAYRINKMMAGGHILYGDPLSRLAGRIADTLLKDYPELRSELRFYTVTSPEVNAFATGQGMIFVNVGLVAQVEDEAQLAFILSHEIIHYYRSHSLEELVGKKTERRTDVDEYGEELDDFLKKHHRSREMEREADSLGIALFYLGSPYYRDVTEGVFDVLQYSMLPFDELPFDTTWFNTPHFKLTGCWLDTVASITSRDNYDDSRSTHPNILSRRRNCAALFDGYSGGERYVMTTKAEFEALRDMARKECIRQEIIHGQYARAFYNTWVMLKNTPDDETLNLYAAQALYGTALCKGHDKEKEAVGDYKEIEGESQQVHYAMKKMSGEIATLLALHKAWELHRRFPNNEAYGAMATDLMTELRTTHSKSVVDYVFEIAVEKEQPQATDSVADNQPKSKYDRIKQKRDKKTKRQMTSYSLTDLTAADADFASVLRSNLNGTAEKPAADTGTTGKIMVFNPTYWVADKHGDMKYSKSDSREADLTERLLGMGSYFGRESVDFSDGGMHRMTSDTQYNDFLTMCEWMNEFWLTKGEYSAQRITQPAMNEMLDRYNARTINMTLVLNVDGKTDLGSMCWALVLPVMAPVFIADALTGNHRTAMTSMIVDARKGKILTNNTYNYDMNDRSELVDAMLYDTYVRAMKPKKDKKKEPTGFMGKHVALMGGANLGLGGRSDVMEKGHLLALTPWASLEVAVSRDVSLAATVRYQKAYEDMFEVIENGYYYEFNRFGGYGTNYPAYKTVNTSKNMLYVALDLHSYSSSDFAPMGRYTNFGLHLVHFTNRKGGESDNTLGFHIGCGNNYIFFHRLLLNWEFDYGYTFGAFKARVDESGTSGTGSKYYLTDALLANVFTVRLGLGFLPF